MLVSVYRWISALIFSRLEDADKDYTQWRARFTLGTYLAAVCWALPVWMFYPQDYPEYQVLMLMGLAGIAGGAVPVLSYEKKIITVFLIIMLLGIESCLLWIGDKLSYEMAFLSFLYFIFLIKGGRDFGKSYHELLALRQDTEDHNLTLLSTTERVARIGYWQWDMKSSQVELSSNLATMFGMDKRLVDLNSCIDMVHEDDRPRVQMVLDSVCMSGRENSIEYRVRDKMNNKWVIMNQVIKRMKDSAGKPFILSTVQDISIIKSAEKKIFDMAYYDELTGLANRGHFRQQLIEQIKYAARNGQKLAVLYIDLDGFKEINDSLGHNTGDIYLQKFSRRLKKQVRDEDFLARLGGDEFCMIIGDIQDGMESVNTAERCLALKHQGIRLDHQTITPQMSIGIAVYPEDGKDVETLLRASDAAMYSAKSRGKHCFAFYDKQMTRDAAARLELEGDLQVALKKNEFYLVYQPKVVLESGTISGVEALIRWQHPVKGLIPPDEFIATAERIGLISEIGDWVLVSACKQLALWKSEGLNLDMAINVSSSHFSSDDFIDRVIQVKEKYVLAEGELEIEITESMSRDAASHIHVCKALHSHGVKVAIDDFGTGYSSLSILKQLEVDTLKVDRTFIQHLPWDETSAMMVKAIVKMGLGLGLGFDIVAEGVETQEQADFLKKLGSTYVQGYYYSRPVGTEEIPQLAKTSLLEQVN